MNTAWRRTVVRTHFDIRPGLIPAIEADEARRQAWNFRRRLLAERNEAESRLHAHSRIDIV